jgi:hypothetical protein
MSLRIVNPPRLDCAQMHRPAPQIIAQANMYQVYTGNSRPNESNPTKPKNTNVPVGTAVGALFTNGLSRQYSVWATVRRG